MILAPGTQKCILASLRLAPAQPMNAASIFRFQFIKKMHELFIIYYYLMKILTNGDSRSPSSMNFSNFAAPQILKRRGRDRAKPPVSFRSFDEFRSVLACYILTIGDAICHGTYLIRLTKSYITP